MSYQSVSHVLPGNSTSSLFLSISLFLLYLGEKLIISPHEYLWISLLSIDSIMQFNILLWLSSSEIYHSSNPHNTDYNDGLCIYGSYFNRSINCNNYFNYLFRNIIQRHTTIWTKKNQWKSHLPFVDIKSAVIHYVLFPL